MAHIGHFYHTFQWLGDNMIFDSRIGKVLVRKELTKAIERQRSYLKEERDKSCIKSIKINIKELQEALTKAKT